MPASNNNWDFQTMKKYLLVAAVAASALFAGSAAMAQDSSGLSYNLAVTSNYVWRGVSQTNGDAALQGGVDYKAKNNFYVGTWLSNVSFAAPKAGQHADTEVDVYAGLAPTMGDWSFDVGAIAYLYPGANSADYGELKAGVAHPMGKGTIGAVMYLPIETLENPYVEVNASYPLTDKLSISGAIANNEANKDEADASYKARNVVANMGTKYTTFNVGATYNLTDHLSVDVRYSKAEQMYLKNSTFVTLKSTF